MIFNNKLKSWYLINKRNLPWRKTKNPYNIWLSEIMLQQTKVAQGLPYYLEYVATFPTVFDLANASEEKVLKLWQGLGYYSRARNLHFTAKYIVANLQGEFPTTYKELIKLKGIGDYTASAIASIAFNEPVAVVDGNVYRVLSRYFGIHTPINSTEGAKEFKALATQLLDVEEPGVYNQAIMELGALQCVPKNPNCIVCPLATGCVALANNIIGVLPVKEKKTKVRKRYFNYVVPITNANTTVLQQRKGKGIWQGLYEFPLVEAKDSVNSVEDLLACKEFQDFSFANYSVTMFNVKEVVHKLSHQHLYTRFWLVKLTEYKKATVSLSEIQKFPVPVLIAKFLEEFKKKQI